MVRKYEKYREQRYEFTRLFHLKYRRILKVSPSTLAGVQCSGFYHIGRNSTVSPIAAAMRYKVETVGTVSPLSILEI